MINKTKLSENKRRKVQSLYSNQEETLVLGKMQESENKKKQKGKRSGSSSSKKGTVNSNPRNELEGSSLRLTEESSMPLPLLYLKNMSEDQYKHNEEQAQEFFRLVNFEAGDNGEMVEYNTDNFKIERHKGTKLEKALNLGEKANITINKEAHQLKVNVQSIDDIKGWADQNKHSQYHQKQLTVIKGMGFSAWRPVRGDGNCYYRSVMPQYLERILIDESQQDRIGKLITDYEKFCQDTYKPGNIGQAKFMKAEEFKKAITELRDTSPKKDILQNIHNRLAYKEDLDTSLIAWLRYKITKEIIDDPDLSINGLPIQFAVQESIDCYIQNTVANMGEDAQDIMFAIVPQILNAQVNTVFVDTKTKASDTTIQSMSSNLDNKGKVKASIGNKTMELFTFLKSGHYDVIYTNEFMNMYHKQLDGKALPSHMGSGFFSELTDQGCVAKSGFEEYEGVKVSENQQENAWKMLREILKNKDKNTHTQDDVNVLEDNLHLISQNQVQNLANALSGTSASFLVSNNTLENRQHV